MLIMLYKWCIQVVFIYINCIEKKFSLVVELVTELQHLETTHHSCQNLLGGANSLFTFQFAQETQLSINQHSTFGFHSS